MEDGIAKAAQGLTTLEEVVRMAAQDEVQSPKGEQRAAVIAPGVEVAPLGPSQRKERVLVVEDSPTVLTVVKYFLELEGFEVLVAENGLAGLEAARRELPRVIVSDINMPGMDGMTMVRALRADPATRGIAVILLTAELSVEMETQGLAAGADDYLCKPVEPRRLAARVKALLARSQAQQLISTQ
jgi:DNA-binding response OmpR family regulator